MDQTETTRLLVVDDEPALREPLAEYLIRQGFAVRQADSGAQARSLLQDELPDLVLLDIMMPGEDGLSLCRHLAEAHNIPTILLTANSTGDYAVQSCLAKYGLKKADVTLKNMGQAEIISAMSSNNAELVGVWAPNIYTLEEKAGAKVMCSGKDGGAIVPGALIVRADYAKEKPQNVAKFLAVYLRAQKWANANRKEAIAMMQKFYEQGGVTISESAMNKEFDTRPTFDLAAQLAAMNRAAGASPADGWFTRIGDFMNGAGSIPDVPAAKSYIDDAFLKMVDSDPKLKAFANRAN